jgi:hypothetical protein
MDEGHFSVTQEKPEVPSDRLCPSGEPNEAMAHRCPNSRMVPAFLAREQSGFKDGWVANETPTSEDQGPHVCACSSIAAGVSTVHVTWTQVPRLGADARDQGHFGQIAGVCLDLSFHSSPRNGGHEFTA